MPHLIKSAMWCFGKVNGKLAEVYFEEKRGKNEIYAHCFVDEKDYKTKREKMWIKEDTKKFKFSFKNSKYTDLQEFREN
ncbi:MAG: hypothetical protein AAB622_02735 [Patescibacteria group bacterium]